MEVGEYEEEARIIEEAVMVNHMRLHAVKPLLAYEYPRGMTSLKALGGSPYGRCPFVIEAIWRHPVSEEAVQITRRLTAANPSA